MEKNSQSFEEVWKLICKYEGQIFHTKRGYPFTYEIQGNSLIVSRTYRPLSKRNFQHAFSLLPIDGPGEINRFIQGPAYVWAILNDKRIITAE
jgi:hypothetical protein